MPSFFFSHSFVSLPNLIGYLSFNGLFIIRKLNIVYQTSTDKTKKFPAKSPLFKKFPFSKGEPKRVSPAGDFIRDEILFHNFILSYGKIRYFIVCINW